MDLFYHVRASGFWLRGFGAFLGGGGSPGGPRGARPGAEHRHGQAYGSPLENNMYVWLVVYGAGLKAHASWLKGVCIESH